MYVKKNNVIHIIGTFERAMEYMDEGYDILSDGGEKLCIEDIRKMFKKTTEFKESEKNSETIQSPKFSSEILNNVEVNVNE